MSEIKDQITFAGSGLNFDDDPRSYQVKGDSNYRLNVVPNEGGNTYTLTNIKGNKKYSHSFIHDATYDGATYTCIGDCYDVKRNAVYLFIYSDLTNHSILRFNLTDKTWNKIVFDNTAIGLDIDYPIVDAFMIGDWLMYNPRSSSPSAINVQWAYYDWIAYARSPELPGSTTWPTGVYVKITNKVYKTTRNDIDITSTPDSPIKTDLSKLPSSAFEYIDWCYSDVLTGSDYGNIGTSLSRERQFINIPRIVNRPLTASVGSDTSVKYNNVRGKMFQFSYRFYISDKGYSIAAPFTEFIVSNVSESYDGELHDDITSGNKITLTLDFRHYTNSGIIYADWLFEYVQILFRTGTQDSWKVAKTLSHSEASYDSTFDYDFYNDSIYISIDDVAVNLPGTALPVLSKAQWSLDGERCAYGCNTEGYDLPSPDVTLTPTFSPVLTETNPSGTVEATHTFSFDSLTHITYGGKGDLALGYKFKSTPITNSGANNEEVILTNYGGRGGYTALKLVASDVDTSEHYANVIARLMNIAGTNAYVANESGVYYVYYESSEFRVGIVVHRLTSTTSAGDAVKVNSYKTGAWHPFCIYYYDSAGRRSGAVTDANMSVYVPLLPESSIVAGTNHKVSMSYAIGHDAPSWATSWRFGYAGNQTVQKFTQYNVDSIAASSDANFASEAYVAINIHGLQTLAVADSSNDNYFPNSLVAPYEFTRGDRIRFITGATAATPTYQNLNKASEGDDYEIKYFDADNELIYIHVDNPTTFVAQYNQKTTVVEIYSPNLSSDDLVYYEVGPIMSVYESSGRYFHNGGTQDQNASQDATGYLTSGDVYLITRTFANSPFSSTTLPVFVESVSLSDFYESSGWNMGKPGYVTNIGQTTNNSIRWSNRFLDVSNNSGLSEFDLSDFINLSATYGDIQAMRQVGSTLRVYFERNSASMLVNKARIYSQPGVSQMILSDNVLNDPTYSPYHYGTAFPESVKMVDRYVYFYDIYRKAFIRDAANGMVPISGKKGSREFDYKMETYFQNKSDDLLESGIDNISVKTAWDEENGLVLVYFHDLLNPINNQNIGFHEGSNRWVSFFSFQTILKSYYEGPFVGYYINDFAYTVNSHVMSFTGTSNDNHIPSDNSLPTVTKGSGLVWNGDVIYISYNGTGNEAVNAKLVVGNGYADINFDPTASYEWMFEILADGSFQPQIVFTQVSIDASLAFTMSMYVIRATNIGPYPSTISNGGGSLYGTIDQDVYLHNDNTVNRCYFYDSQYSSKVKVVGTEASTEMKRFDTMTIHSNKPWDVTDITLDTTASYPNGMESKLPEGKFVLREGVYYAEYLRNMKTTSSTANNLDLINGDRLRGYVIENTLENDDTTEVNLFKVDINSTISKV